jgi:Cu(I)/Ag(I) efflux system periplasmic protein CusF
MEGVSGSARSLAVIMATTIGACAATTGASTNSLGTEQPHEVPAQAETHEPTGIFRGVGIIKAIDPRTGALTLAHEEIKGLMPAMEMMYRVKSRVSSEGLREGDKIGFTLDAKSYTILDVKVIERAK